MPDEPERGPIWSVPKGTQRVFLFLFSLQILVGATLGLPLEPEDSQYGKSRLTPLPGTLLARTRGRTVIVPPPGHGCRPGQRLR